MSPDLFSVLTIAITATVTAALASRFILPVFLEQSEIRKKRKVRVKELIEKKLSSDIVLNAQDIVDIGRGAGASQGLATEALYQLFAESDDKERYVKLKELLAELQREEPFESLPPEARPSLARIAILCNQSDQTTDRELLHPITTLLQEHQELKQERAAIKRQGRISYVVALVSFFIGVVGLILAFTGPTKDFITKELESNRQQILKDIGSPTKPSTATK